MMLNSLQNRQDLFKVNAPEFHQKVSDTFGLLFIDRLKKRVEKAAEKRAERLEQKDRQKNKPLKANNKQPVKQNKLIPQKRKLPQAFDDDDNDDVESDNEEISDDDFDAGIAGKSYLRDQNKAVAMSQEIGGSFPDL